MGSDITKKVVVESSCKFQNTLDDMKPLVCRCNVSARFVPLYRFNTSGVQSQIVLGGRPMMMCPNCNQVYRWGPPSAPGNHDGGWERTSFLQDREELGD